MVEIKLPQGYAGFFPAGEEAVEKEPENRAGQDFFSSCCGVLVIHT